MSSTERIEAYRENMQRARKQSAGKGLDAFNELWAEAERLGRGLDSLESHSEDEVERFFSKVVYGTLGHVYWRAGVWIRNDGIQQVPRRWWWEHSTGEKLSQASSVVPECGELRCINPAHSVKVARRERLYTDRYLIGRLQVVAIQLGHTPRMKEWDRLRLGPWAMTYLSRFGTWEATIRAALLPPMGQKGHATRVSQEQCLAALRKAHELLGKWPSVLEYRGLNAELKAAGLPTSTAAINKHCGNWADALDLAGRKS